MCPALLFLLRVIQCCQHLAIGFHVQLCPIKPDLLFSVGSCCVGLRGCRPTRLLNQALLALLVQRCDQGHCSRSDASIRLLSRGPSCDANMMCTLAVPHMD